MHYINTLSCTLPAFICFFFGFDIHIGLYLLAPFVAHQYHDALKPRNLLPHTHAQREVKRIARSRVTCHHDVLSGNATRRPGTKRWRGAPQRSLFAAPDGKGRCFFIRPSSSYGYDDTAQGDDRPASQRHCRPGGVQRVSQLGCAGLPASRAPPPAC